jgi:Domain of unknown function (DUF1902)
MKMLYRLGNPCWKLMEALGASIYCRIDVQFDPAAHVYIATSPDLKGLVVEAATKEEMFREVPQCIEMILHVQDNHRVTTEPRTVWSGDACLA